MQISSRQYSNGQYANLGDRIRKDITNISESDYEMLQYLRTSYKEPLSIVFRYVEELAHRVDSNCVCTYRVKRIESIISKLIRFPKMCVNRAEDIAGCRCIMTSDNAVYALYNSILKKQDKLPFEIKGKVNDYISNPKDSGYKSLHLNVVLKNDNRRIEIQLRSIEQHNWATLVEISDLLYGLKIKENGADSNPQLYRLHQLLSRSLNSLSFKEIQEISDIVISHNYLQKIGGVFANNYVAVRKHWYSLKLRDKHFFLISTGIDCVPDIQGFSDFDSAEQKYFEQFMLNKANKNIVLTHLKKTNFAKISAAYSNYFLTFNNTIVRILFILSKAVEETYKKNSICSFKKYYQAYLDTMLFWMQQQIVEMHSFKDDNNIRKSKVSHREWELTIAHGVKSFNQMFRNTHDKLSFRIWNLMTYVAMKSKYKIFTQEAKKLIGS